MKSALMKLSMAILLTNLFTTNASAHCTGYHMHHCSVSGVVGGLGYELSHIGEYGQDFVSDPVGTSVQIWHDFYGSVPSWARHMINEYGPSVVGFAIAGMEGAALGETLKYLYADIENSAKASKRVKTLQLSVSREQAVVDLWLQVADVHSKIARRNGPEDPRMDEATRLGNQYEDLIINAPSDARARELILEVEDLLYGLIYS